MLIALVFVECGRCERECPARHVTAIAIFVSRLRFDALLRKPLFFSGGAGGSAIFAMLFPLPRPLPDLLRDTTSSLTPLDKAGAVANALLLASHPWLLRSSHSPPRWTLESLRGELSPLFHPEFSRCAGDLHWAQNGTVYYSDDGRARRRRTREPSRFPLFDACDGGAADASLAQAPPVHRQALERLGVGPARAAYCAHI